MLLRTCNLANFIERVKDSDLQCFGAGRYLQGLCSRYPLIKLEKYIKHIADSNSELWGGVKKINGTVIPIISPETLYKNIKKNDVLLICANSKNSTEIYDMLEARLELKNTECYLAHFLTMLQDKTACYKNSPDGWRMNNKPVIPKKIHYFWLGGNKIPEQNRKYMETWHKFCPDYEIIEWNESNYDFLKHPYMRQAYEARKWGFVTDYARLDILYTHGGIYLDTDVEIIRPLEELLYNTAYSGFQYNMQVATGLGFGCIPGLPIIKDMRDDYDRLSFINSNGNFILTACPQIQTDLLKRRGLLQNGNFQIIEDMAVYPTEYFSPFDFRKIGYVTAKTYSIHWYEGTWVVPELRVKNIFVEKLYELASQNEVRINNEQQDIF